MDRRLFVNSFLSAGMTVAAAPAVFQGAILSSARLKRHNALLALPLTTNPCGESCTVSLPSAISRRWVTSPGPHFFGVPSLSGSTRWILPPGS